MAQRGVIKWFDSKKGFGFSTPAEGGTDIFVHHTHITTVQGRPVLDEGDEIAYDLGEHNGRPTAIKVTMANGDPVSGLRRRTGGRPPRGSGGDDGDAKGDAEPEANGEVSPAKEGVLEPSDVTSYARDGKTRREGGRRDGQPSSRSKSGKGGGPPKDSSGQGSRRNQVRSDVAAISGAEGSAADKVEQDADISVPKKDGGGKGKGKGSRPRSGKGGRGKGEGGGKGGGGGRGSGKPAEAVEEGPTSTEA